MTDGWEVSRTRFVANAVRVEASISRLRGMGRSGEDLPIPYLEAVVQSELHQAPSEERAGDFAEVGGRDGLVGHEPRRVIEDVRGVHAELQAVPPI